MQCIAVGAVIAALPDQLHVLPQVPWWLERAGLFLGGVWFVNLVNFMDGIDWMTVAEFVPVTGAMVLLGLSGTIGTVALGGRRRAPWMRSSALRRSTSRSRALFLGDVGSLPIGLVLGWLLLQLAAERPSGGGLILPLYYLADATITLVRRVARGEPFWQAHRTHFYQRATDNGFTVPEIVRPASFWSISRWRRLRPSPSRRTRLSVAGRAGMAIAAVAGLLLTFAGPRGEHSRRFAAEIRHRVVQHAE